MQRVRDEWLRRSGVTGLDVGLRRENGRLTQDLAVRVYVKHKLALDVIPAGERFPKKLGQFDVDVIESEALPQMSGPGG